VKYWIALWINELVLLILIRINLKNIMKKILQIKSSLQENTSKQIPWKSYFQTQTIWYIFMDRDKYVIYVQKQTKIDSE
jgi:hypothetical protein